MSNLVVMLYNKSQIQYIYTYCIISYYSGTRALHVTPRFQTQYLVYEVVSNNMHKNAILVLYPGYPGYPPGYELECTKKKNTRV